MRDLYSNILTIPALAPAVQTAAATGASIDMSAAGALAFVVNTGAIAGDGAFGVTIQESADGTNWAAAPATSIQTNAPSVLGANATYRLGYIGHKRYARLSLTKASGTSIAAGAVAILDPLASRWPNADSRAQALCLRQGHPIGAAMPLPGKGYQNPQRPV